MKNTTAKLTLYGSSDSGNCLKPRWICDYHKISYVWHEVDLAAGATRTPEFLALNPAGQVPLAHWGYGRVLTQSNAIMLYLADSVNSDFIPQDPFMRAKMHAWMFWEQYSHEPYIAVRRSWLHVLGRSETEIDPALLKKGNRALAHMEGALQDTDFLLGDSPSLADIAVFAYTRWAHEGGFEMAQFPNIQSWLDRCDSNIIKGK